MRNNTINEIPIFLEGIDSRITEAGEQKRKGRKKNYKNKSKTINKMGIRKYILIITLNENELNAPTKRHRLAEWIQK